MDDVRACPVTRHYYEKLRQRLKLGLTCWLCNCGAPLDGTHNHYDCGDPIPETEATAEGFELGGES